MKLDSEKSVVGGTLAIVFLALLIKLGALVFFGWLIFKVLQHFGIV